MACCAVFGCNNNKKKNKDLKFYGFPKEENIAKQWVVACRRKDAINIKSARVCSAHFEKSDFFESLRHRLLGYSPRNCRNLKEDAIPSVRVPLKKDANTSSKRSIRVEKRARRKMANEILDKTSPEADDDVLEQQETSLSDALASSVEALQELQDQQDRLGIINSSVEGVENEEDILDTSTINSSAVTDQSPYKNLGQSRIHSSVTNGPAVPECECKCLVTAANILAAKSMIKLQRENEELKGEITELNNQLQYLKNERKNFISERLKPIFTDGQIRCLFQPVRKRICWSDEDITSAITLRSVSPNAYRYLREKLNYPLPAVSTLRKWVRMKLEREPSQQILDLVRAKLPSLASLED